MSVPSLARRWHAGAVAGCWDPLGGALVELGLPWARQGQGRDRCSRHRQHRAVLWLGVVRHVLDELEGLLRDLTSELCRCQACAE
eukprot:455275-Alexandrium_andersonii.AAC.1